MKFFKSPSIYFYLNLYYNSVVYSIITNPNQIFTYSGTIICNKVLQTFSSTHCALILQVSVKRVLKSAIFFSKIQMLAL